jgi:RimJ/RimL family protein N-acetyltransferase
LVLLRGTDTVVASSGLHRIDWSVPKFEVGFWGRTSFQGKGYVTEGVSAIVIMAFDHLKARRVEALPDDLNERSCRVCERLGFLLEGTLRHERIDPDGTLRNTRVYAKVR